MASLASTRGTRAAAKARRRPPSPRGSAAPQASSTRPPSRPTTTAASWDGGRSHSLPVTVVQESKQELDVIESNEPTFCLL
ncbi:hypothetical protein MRX96_050273 [Rhipicephalus microplus]